MPAFTIITVCLNIATTIRRTCESIVNQTFQDFQWIVVDGASTDGTLDILKEYSSRIDILISEPDKGIYNAMNKGIKLATGEYINFMNGGDEFFNNEVLQKVVDAKPTADVIYGDEYKVKGEKKYLFKNWESVTPELLYQRYGIAHQSSFTKTIVLKKYGFNENYKISADYDFFIKICKKGYSFCKIPITVNIFYEVGISINQQQLTEQEYLKIKKNNFKIIHFLNEHPSIASTVEFIRNSLKHPRFFAGWIKGKLKV